MSMEPISLVRRIHALLHGARPSGRHGAAIASATAQLQGRVEHMRARGREFAAVRLSKHVAALRDVDVSDRVEGHPVPTDGLPDPSFSHSH